MTRLFFLLALFLASRTAQAQFTPIDLDPAATIRTYPEKRWNLRSQSWWLPAGQTDEGRHVHFETAFPQGQTVSGIVDFEVKVLMHNMPTTSRGTLVRVMQKSDRTLYKKSVSMVPDANGDVEQWHKFSYDTRNTHDGINEIRCTLKVHHANGDEQFQSSGWCFVVDNGRSDSNDRPTRHWCEARGWYDLGFDYANARTRSPLPWEPVPDSWEFYVELVPGSGGDLIHSHQVLIDPDFHHGIPGLPLITTETDGVAKWVKPGPFRGYLGPDLQVFGTTVQRIDTRGLASGLHRLALISHQVRSGVGRNSGVLVIPFFVE